MAQNPNSGGRPDDGPQSAAATYLGPSEMALDTVASILRILGEYALEQEHQDAATFTRLCEQWAQHVTVASPPPAGDGAAGRLESGRRDWNGVRAFVREYCQNSSQHARTVMGDLRQVVWVFIQNLSHAFAESEEADSRIREQLSRLEKLAQTNATGELKKEVLTTVVTLGQVVEERRKKQASRVETLGAQVRTLGSELEEARKESEFDPLTRLFNRRAFDDYLARTVELARVFKQPACLLLVDLDRFKLINDTFGHAEGDAVLRKLADGVTRMFPRKNDFVARYGGDEVAIVLRETTLREAVPLGERALKAARGIKVERESVHLTLSASVGIAQLGPGEDANAWFERTDRALYRAKSEGRDRLAEADPPGTPTALVKA